jgi:hypothetical protein
VGRARLGLSGAADSPSTVDLIDQCSDADY